MNLFRLKDDNSTNQKFNERALVFVAVVLACFGLSQTAQAVTPAPDGGYPDFNTAEGDDALFSLTTGVGNAAIGAEALFSNTTGNFNTATGVGALINNTTASNNTATGAGALFSNTTIGVNSGDDNTATGFAALYSNTTGRFNTASGSQALGSNTTGNSNSANGYQALFHNNSGFENTASGDGALFSNTDGESNTAVGYQALLSNSIGVANTAIGDRALFANTGSDNIALGAGAGESLTTGSHNIDIGSSGAAAESGTIRIGNGIHTSRAFIAGIVGVNEGNFPTAVFINTTTGQLGTTPPASSRRFKKEIKPMDHTSEAILGLKPVTFQYKSDTKNTPQFGLIAEEVAELNPDLVVRDDNGEIYTVRYDAVNAMLLNEFLKQHRKVEEHNRKVEDHHRKAQEMEATIAQLKSTLAQQQKDFQATAANQQKQIEALTAGLQKVSAQVEMIKPAPPTVADNH
jgi:Chaperone of endosialidase